MKREIAAAQAENETLVSLREKLAKEEQSLADQTGKVLQERDQLAERYQMLQRSLVQTEEEEKAVEAQKEELAKQIETVVQNVQVTSHPSDPSKAMPFAFNCHFFVFGGRAHSRMRRHGSFRWSTVSGNNWNC